MAYVGSYTAEGGDGLTIADVDPATGTLTVTSTVPKVPDASWLARSPDGRRLYATNEHDQGSVTVLDTETLAVLDIRPIEGDAPTHLSVHPTGRFLLVANYGSGSVTVLPLAADGGIGPVSDLVRYPTGAHAHQVLTDPSGRWVLVVDLGTDSVHIHRLDLDTGTLHSHQRMAAGPGPRHLVFHPDGTRAYLVCEYASQVIVCDWNATTGTLTAGQVVPTVEPGAVTPNYPAEGVMSSDGRFLYVTNRGDNSVATFSVLEDTVRLLDTVPVGGDWPRHAALDPTERRLYVSNQRSGTVTWLPRDPDRGALSAVDGLVAVPAVAVVLFA